jgi:hypothetical protein
MDHIENMENVRSMIYILLSISSWNPIMISLSQTVSDCGSTPHFCALDRNTAVKEALASLDFNSDVNMAGGVDDLMR